MASASGQISKEELVSRLGSLMPSRVAKNVAENMFKAPQAKAKRVMLYDMKPAERNLVSFPLEQLREAGVEVPKMGKDAIFVSTGPDNGQLINKDKETVAFRFRGNDIICSINGSAPIKLGMQGGKRTAEYM
ncbi:hypothetical protein JW721_01950 [Candidatus Micrarchaeota archaeon]|nr:hypothetical protein [Candidatus Micrarchaeota archaeon]